MPPKTLFKPIPKKEIISQLKQKKLEDFDTIRYVEAFMKKKNGYIFNKLNPKDPVILQMSGGVDSTITAHLLMKKYGLTIYPLFINRGQSRLKKEESAIDFFSQYLSNLFPSQFKPVFKMKAKIPPWEIRPTIIHHASKKKFKNSEQRWGIPLYASLLASYSVNYGFYLEQTKKIKIRTILCAALNSDAIQMAHHTLTGLRSITFNIGCQTNDFTWQFTSPLIEKELNQYYGKPELIRWANQYKLPIHKTWSCYYSNKYHCGQCDSCWARRNAFAQTNTVDRTIYLKNTTHKPLKMVRLLKKKITSFIFQSTT